MAKAGIDPRMVNKLRNEGAPTFAEAAEMVITERSRDWKEGSSSEMRMRGYSQERSAFPKIGHKRVDQITEDDIIKMLDPLWHTKRVTANFLLGYTKNIFAWCKRKKYRDDNPVTDTVREYAPTKKHRVKHMPFVPYYQVGAALRTIREYGRSRSPQSSLPSSRFTRPPGTGRSVTRAGAK